MIINELTPEENLSLIKSNDFNLLLSDLRFWKFFNSAILSGIIIKLFQKTEMTYSQINPTKVGGFSRRSLNLNHFGQGHERFRCFPDLRYLGYKQHFGKGFKALWAVGYYCGSAGHVSQDAVKRYIMEQQGKDVFEYSIFGDATGQTKIGDFSC